MTRSILAAMALIAALTALADDGPHPLAHVYPAAEKGQVRHVIALPHLPEPDRDRWVEVVPGRTLRTDGVNQTRMGIFLTKHVIEGWGYPYYEVGGDTNQVMQTLMAPAPGSEPRDTWVAGNGIRLDYNPKLPIVVYAPRGVEVRWRIWTAEDRWRTTSP